MTEIEKKEYQKKYYEKNKEYFNQYYQKNKDKILKNQKNRYKENNEYYTEYQKNNLEKIKEYQKKYQSNLKDGYHRVYLLEDYNYVGVTNDIKTRFGRHRRDNNRDCTNYRILYKTKNRNEALELESLLHDLGYKGKNNIFTK